MGPKEVSTPNAWRTAPRKAVVIFLLAVFFVFAAIGVASDSMDMGRQPALRFATSVLVSGLFAVLYAGAGIILRGRFWKAFLPLFALQFFVIQLVGNLMPVPPSLAEYNPAQTAHLHLRMVFDGLAVIVFIALGYTGFAYVSISEGKRHLKAQLEKAALESEMAAAREVQRVMVPENLPTIPGYLFESVYKPAAEVGGDFFQVLPLSGARTLVVIGDVSGKGLGAAMLVSMIVGVLRTAVSFTDEPGEILGHLNRSIFGRMQDGFATCLVIRLEPGGGLTLANAGHPAPYINGAEVALEGSVPLGIVETEVYGQARLQLRVGDVAMLLTDGIPEAQDSGRALFGFARIESMLRGGVSSKTLAEAAQDHGQTDDITVISLACAT